jgi:hypothetical protein
MTPNTNQPNRGNTNDPSRAGAQSNPSQGQQGGRFGQAGQGEREEGGSRSLGSSSQGGEDVNRCLDVIEENVNKLRMAMGRTSGAQGATGQRQGESSQRQGDESSGSEARRGL